MPPVIDGQGVIKLPDHSERRDGNLGPTRRYAPKAKHRKKQGTGKRPISGPFWYILLTAEITRWGSRHFFHFNKHFLRRRPRFKKRGCRSLFAETPTFQKKRGCRSLLANAQAWYGFLQNVYKFHYTALHQKRARTLGSLLLRQFFCVSFLRQFWLSFDSVLRQFLLQIHSSSSITNTHTQELHTKKLDASLHLMLLP